MHEYRVAVELEGADGSVHPADVVLRGASVWRAVGGLRRHLCHAPWCAAQRARVVGVEGPGADELRPAGEWFALDL